MDQTERYACYEAAKSLATEQAFINAATALESRANDDELILCLRSLDVRKIATNALNSRYTYVHLYLDALHHLSLNLINDGNGTASLPTNTSRSTVTGGKGTSSSSNVSSSSSSSSSSSVDHEEHVTALYELLQRCNTLGMNCFNGNFIVENPVVKEWRDTHIHANIYSKPQISLSPVEYGTIGYKVTKYLSVIITAVCAVSGNKLLKGIMNEIRRFLLQGVRLYFSDARVSYQMRNNDRTNWQMTAGSGQMFEHARFNHAQDVRNPNVTLEDTIKFITHTYESCVQKLYDRLMNLSERDLRCLQYNDLYRMTEVEESFRGLHGSCEVASQMVYKFRFHSSVRGLKAPILDWRIQGARDLNSLAMDAEANDEKHERRGYWIRCHEFIVLVEESHIMDDLLGELFHLEVMKALPRVFRIIVNNKKWNQTLTSRLWLTSQNRHSAEQSAILHQLNTVIHSEVDVAVETFALSTEGTNIAKHDPRAQAGLGNNLVRFHHCYLPTFRQVCYLLEAAYLPVDMRSHTNPYGNTEEIVQAKRQDWATVQYQYGVAIDTILAGIDDTDTGTMRKYLENLEQTIGSSNVGTLMRNTGNQLTQEEIKVVPYHNDSFTLDQDILFQPHVIPYIGLESNLPKAIEDLLEAMSITLCSLYSENNRNYFCLEKSTIVMFINLLTKFYRTAPCPTVSTWTVPNAVEDLRFPARPVPDPSIQRSMDNMLSPCARTVLRILHGICHGIEKTACVKAVDTATNKFHDYSVSSPTYVEHRSQFIQAYQGWEQGKKRPNELYFQFLEFYVNDKHFAVALNFPPVLHGNSIVYECLKNVCIDEGLELANMDSSSLSPVSSSRATLHRSNITLSSSSVPQVFINDPSRLPRLAAFIAYMGQDTLEGCETYEKEGPDEAQFSVPSGFTRNQERFIRHDNRGGFVDFVSQEFIVRNLLVGMGGILRKAVHAGTELTGTTIDTTGSDPSLSLRLAANANPFVIHTFLAILHLLRALLRFNLVDFDGDGLVENGLLLSSIVQRDFHFAGEDETDTSIIESTGVLNIPAEKSAFVGWRKLAKNEGDNLSMDETTGMNTTTMSTVASVTNPRGNYPGKRSSVWAVENDPDWLILPGIPNESTHASVTMKDIQYLFDITKDNEITRHALLLFIADGVGWNGPPDTNLYIQLLQAPTKDHNAIGKMQQQDAGFAVPFNDRYLLSRRSEFIYEVWNYFIDYFICNGTNLANMDRYDLYAFRTVFFARNSNDDLWTQIYFDPIKLVDHLKKFIVQSPNKELHGTIDTYVRTLKQQLQITDPDTEWVELGSKGRALFPLLQDVQEFYTYLADLAVNDPEKVDNIFYNHMGKRPIHLLRPGEKPAKGVNPASRALQVASFDDIIGLCTFLQRILLYTHSEGIWTSVAETLIGLAMACDDTLRSKHINSFVNRILSLLQRIDPTRSGSGNKRARSVNEETGSSNIGSSSSSTVSTGTNDTSEYSIPSPSLSGSDLLSEEDIQQMSLGQRQECVRRLLFLYRRLVTELPERYIRGNAEFFNDNDAMDVVRLLRSHYDENSADLMEITVQVAIFDENEMRKAFKDDVTRWENQPKYYGNTVPKPIEDMPFFLSRQQSSGTTWTPARKVTIKVNSNDTIEAIRHRIADLYHTTTQSKHPRALKNNPIFVFPAERTELDNAYDINRISASLILIDGDTCYGSDLGGYDPKIPIHTTQVTNFVGGNKKYLQSAENLVDPYNNNLRESKLREYINNILLTRSVQAGPLMVPLASTGDVYYPNSFTGWRAMVVLDAGAIGSIHTSRPSLHDDLLDGRVSSMVPAVPIPVTDSTLSSTSNDFGNVFVAGSTVLDPSVMRIFLNILSSPVNLGTDTENNDSILESLRCEVWKTLNYTLPTSPLVLGLLASHRVQWTNVFSANPSSVPSSPSFSSPSAVAQSRNARVNSSGYSVPSIDEIGLTASLFYGGTLASVYLLQSVIAYLRPPIEPLTWMAPNEGPIAWSRRFIHEGGLQAILGYLIQSSAVATENIDENMDTTTTTTAKDTNVPKSGLSSLVPKLLRIACLRIILCLLEVSAPYTLSPANEYKEIVEKLQKVYKVIPDSALAVTNAMDAATDAPMTVSIPDLVYSVLTNDHKEMLIRLLWSQIAGEEADGSTVLHSTPSLTESSDTVMDIAPLSANPPVPPRFKRGRSLESSVDPSEKNDTSGDLTRTVTKDDDSTYYWYTNTKLLRYQTGTYVGSIVSAVNDRALRDGIKMLQLLIDNENKHRPTATSTVTLSTASTDTKGSAFERSIGPRQIRSVLRTLLYDPAKVGTEGQKALLHCIEKLIKESPRLAEAIVHESLDDLTKFVTLLDPENKALDTVVPLSMVTAGGDPGDKTMLRQYADDICTGKVAIDIKIPSANRFDLRGANIESYMNLIKLAIDSMGKSNVTSPSSSSSSTVTRTSSVPFASTATMVTSSNDHQDLTNLLHLLMRTIAACSLSLVPESRTVDTLDSMMMMTTITNDTSSLVTASVPNATSNIGATAVSTVSSANATAPVPETKVIYPFTAVPLDTAIFLNSLVAVVNSAVRIVIPSAIDSVRLVNLLLYHGLYRPVLPLLGSIGSTLDVHPGSRFASLKTRKYAWEITQALAMPPSTVLTPVTDVNGQLLRNRLVSDTADFVRSILEEGNLPTRSSASPWLRYGGLPFYSSSSHTSYTALSSAIGTIGGVIQKDGKGVTRTASGIAGNTMKALSTVLPSTFPSMDEITGTTGTAGNMPMVPLVTTAGSSPLPTGVPPNASLSFFRLPKDIAFYTGLFIRLWSRLEGLASQGLWEQHALAAGAELRRYCAQEETANRLPFGLGDAIVNRLNVPIQRPNLLPSLLGGEAYEIVSIIDFARNSNFLLTAVSQGVWYALETEKFTQRLTEQALKVVAQNMDISEGTTGTYSSNLQLLGASPVYLSAVTRYVLCYIFILLQAVARTIDPRFVTGIGLTATMATTVPPSTDTTGTSNAKGTSTKTDKPASSTDSGNNNDPSPSHSLPYDILYSVSQFALSLYLGNSENYSVHDLLTKSPFTVLDQVIIAIGNRSTPRIDFTPYNDIVKGYAGLLLLANQEGFTDVDNWIAHVRLFSKTDRNSRELSLATLQNSSYIHREIVDDFEARADAVFGCYVGIKNQGATCYMNGLLQQMFMIPALRHAILSAPALSANALEKYSYPDAVRKLRNEMQLLFTALCFSNRLFYDPLSFVVSCDNIPSGFFPLDSPVKAQNDASEFFLLLLDRLGHVFPYPTVASNSVVATVNDEPTTEVSSPKVPSDIFTATIGGVIVNQIIGQGECKHTQNREENFLSLSIDVQGNDTIEKSLKAFVQGELLAGENAYMCEKCNKKVDALKRSCIASLPDNLIVHLKRFRLNYETLNKEKVNDALKFGFNVDLYPFTATGLAEAEGTLPKGTVPPHFITREDCLYELRGVLVHSGHAGGGHYYSFICPRDGDHLPGSGSGLRALAAQYRHRRHNLPAHVAQIFAVHAEAGVDVDALFTESGSVTDKGGAPVSVSDSAENGNFSGQNTTGWLEFNDETVAAFDASPANCEAVWFGGVASPGGGDNKKARVRSTNAFMLFYDRVRPSVPSSSSSTIDSTATSVVPHHTMNDTSFLLHHPVPQAFARKNMTIDTSMTIGLAQQALRSSGLPIIVPSLAADLIKQDNNKYLRSVYVGETPSVGYLCSAAKNLVKAYETEALDIAAVYERAKGFLQKRQLHQPIITVPLTEKYLQSSHSLYHIITHADSIQRLLFGALAKQIEKSDTRELVKNAVNVLVAMAGNDELYKKSRKGTGTVTRDTLLSDVMYVLQITDTPTFGSNEPVRQTVTVGSAVGGIGTSDEGTQDAYRVDVLENIVRGLTFPGIDIYWDTNGTALHMTDTMMMIAGAITPTNSPKLSGKGTSSATANTTVPVTPTAPTIRDCRHLSAVFEVAFNQSKDGALTRIALKGLLPTVARMLGTIAEPLGSYINGENIEEEVTLLGLPYPLLSEQYRQYRINQRNNQGTTGAEKSGNPHVVDLTMDTSSLSSSSTGASFTFQSSPLETFRFTRATRALRALDLLVRTLLPFFGVVICNPLSDAYESFVQSLIDIMQSHPVAAAIMVRNHALEWVLQVLHHSQGAVWTGSSHPLPNSSPFDTLIGRMQDLTVATTSTNMNTSYGNFGYVDDADLATALLAFTTPTDATEGRQITTFSELHMTPLYTLLSTIVRATYVPDLNENERDTLNRPPFTKLVPVTPSVSSSSASTTSLVSSTVTSTGGNPAVALTHEQSPFAVFKETTIRPRFRTTVARDYLCNPAWLYRFIRAKFDNTLRNGFMPAMQFLQHLCFGNPHISSMFLIALADLTYKGGMFPIVVETSAYTAIDELVTNAKLNTDGYQMVRLTTILYTLDERHFSRPLNSPYKMTSTNISPPVWTVPNHNSLESAPHDKRVLEYGPRTLPYATLPPLHPIVIETLKAHGVNPWLDYAFGTEEERKDYDDSWNLIRTSSDETSNASSTGTTGGQPFHRCGLASYILDIVTVFAFNFVTDGEDISGPAPKRLEMFNIQRDKIDNNYYDYIAQSIQLVYRVWSKASPMVREAMMKLPTFVPWVPTVRDILCFTFDRMSHIIQDYSGTVNNEWKNTFVQAVTFLREMTGSRKIRFHHRYVTAPSVFPHQYLQGGADPSANTALFNPDEAATTVTTDRNDENDPDGSYGGGSNTRTADPGDYDIDRRDTEPTGPSYGPKIGPTVPTGRPIVGAGTGVDTATLVPGGEKLTGHQAYRMNLHEMDDKNSVDVAGGDDDDRNALLQSPGDEYDTEDVRGEWEAPSMHETAKTLTQIGQIYNNPDHAMDLGPYANLYNQDTMNRTYNAYSRYTKEPIDNEQQIPSVLQKANLPPSLPEALKVLCNRVHGSWSSLPEIVNNIIFFVREGDMGDVIAKPEHVRLWTVWAIVEYAVTLNRMQLEDIPDIDTLCNSYGTSQTGNAYFMLCGTYDTLARNFERWPIYLAAYGYVPLIDALLTKPFNEFKKQVMAYHSSPPVVTSPKGMNTPTLFEGGKYTGASITNRGSGATTYGTTTTTTTTKDGITTTTSYAVATNGRNGGMIPFDTSAPDIRQLTTHLDDVDDEYDIQEEEMRFKCLTELDNASRIYAISTDRSGFDSPGSDTEEYTELLKDHTENYNVTEAEYLCSIGRTDTDNHRLYVLTWAMFRTGVKVMVENTGKENMFNYVYRWSTGSPDGLPPLSSTIKQNKMLLSCFGTFGDRVQYVLQDWPAFLELTSDSFEGYMNAVHQQQQHKQEKQRSVSLAENILYAGKVDVSDDEVLAEITAGKLHEFVIPFITAINCLFRMNRTVRETVHDLHTAIRLSMAKDHTRNHFWHMLKVADELLSLHPAIRPATADTDPVKAIYETMMVRVTDIFHRYQDPRRGGRSAHPYGFHDVGDIDNDEEEDEEDANNDILGAVFIADYYSWLLAFAKNIQAQPRGLPSLTTTTNPNEAPAIHNRPTFRSSPVATHQHRSLPIPPLNIAQMKDRIRQQVDKLFDEDEKAIEEVDTLLKQLRKYYTSLWNNPEKADTEVAFIKAAYAINLVNQNLGGIPDDIPVDLNSLSPSQQAQGTMKHSDGEEGEELSTESDSEFSATP